MNLLKLMTMTLWFAMCMATKNHNAENNIDNSVSFVSEGESITDPKKEHSQEGYDENAKKFEEHFQKLSEQIRTGEKDHATAQKELEEANPEIFQNSPELFQNFPEVFLEDLEDVQEHNEEAEDPKISDNFAHSQEVENPRTLEKIVQTDSQVAQKKNCPLCEMEVLVDDIVQCDTCKQFQKAGDKVMGNNDCHCYGRNGNHHCANCSKKRWGKDLYEGEEIVGERSAGNLFATPPVLTEDGLISVAIKVPEKCDQCQKLTGQHISQEDKLHIQKNGKEICDDCLKMKQAREQQRREKNMPSETHKNHGSERAPKIVSLKHKTPEDSTLKRRIILMIIAIAAIISIISITVCCKSKPKKRTSKAPQQKEVIVREVRSQPGQVHIIRV